MVGSIVEELVGGYNCTEPCINEKKMEKNTAWKVEW